VWWWPNIHILHTHIIRLLRFRHISIRVHYTHTHTHTHTHTQRHVRYVKYNIRHNISPFGKNNPINYQPLPDDTTSYYTYCKTPSEIPRPRDIRYKNNTINYRRHLCHTMNTSIYFNIAYSSIHIRGKDCTKTTQHKL